MFENIEILLMVTSVSKLSVFTHNLHVYNVFFEVGCGPKMNPIPGGNSC